MPVVITVLNAYSGFALVAEGFMLDNSLLTTVGALIGVSGSILSYIMCVAMNRSLTNVLFGGIASTPQEQAKIEGEITKTSAEETAEALANAENVIIVSRHINFPVQKIYGYAIIKYKDLLIQGFLGRWLWNGGG